MICAPIILLKILNHITFLGMSRRIEGFSCGTVRGVQQRTFRRSLLRVSKFLLFLLSLPPVTGI